jgi:hypothetical protein
MPKFQWWVLALVAILALGGAACRLTSEALENPGDRTPTPQYNPSGQEPEATPTPTRRSPRTTPTEEGGAASGPTTAAVTDLFLSLDEKGEQPSTTFGQGDPIYLYGLLDTPDAANLMAAWTAVEAEGNAPNTLIYQFPEESYPAGPFWFRLEWPRPWAFGRYNVKLYVNGRLERTLEYEITETNTSTASITDTYLALDQEGQQATQVFGPGDTFNLHFNLVDAAPDTPLRVIWSARNVEGWEPNSFINEYAALMSSGPNWMSIQQAQPWELGEYQAHLFINSQLAQTVPFTVTNTNTDGAAISSAFTARDEAGSDQTATFTTEDSIYVHFTLENAPTDAAVTVSLAQVDETGYHTFIDKYRQVFTNGDYYVFFTPTDTWKPGGYAIYVYVNGELSQTLEATVR